MLSSPYADILAARRDARRDRRPVPLSIPARIRDTGAPSDAALRARDARLAADCSEAERRDAMLTARGDYPPFTADPFTFNGGRFRTARGA